MVRRQIRLIPIFCVILCGVQAGANSLLLAKEWGAKSAGSKTTPQVQTQPTDQFSKASADLEMVNFIALRRAIRDLAKTFPTRYTKGQDYLQALDRYEGRLPKIKKALKQRDKAA
ncbi:MAG: hypothetical protein ACYTDW_18685, partial [Planctomycetota bacterium]